MIYRLVPRENGRTDKVPVDPISGTPIDAHEPGARMLPSEARSWWEKGAGDGVGIVITEESALWFLDIDHCRDGNAWAPHVTAFLGQFPNCYVEVSASGSGLHALGKYSGTRPRHGTRNKMYRLELYTAKRFAALTGTNALGSILTDHTVSLHALARDYFPVRDDNATSDGLSSAAVPEWSGPEDDDELLKRALNSHSGAAAFGGKASFADLFNANEAVLARAFPPQSPGQSWDNSAADQALANHLAFWTGAHGERILALMYRSQLVRDKWERQGYLRATIQRACGSTRRWYNDSRALTGSSNAEAHTGISGNTSQDAQEARITVADFYAYLPDHKYIFIPTGELWPAQGVNAKLVSFDGGKPSRWLDENRSVTQMTWAPGEPPIIVNRVVSNGEWIERADCACFNLYRSPSATNAEASEAQVSPWLDHLRRVYPADVPHLVCWFAHRVQRPGDKINHALVLGGNPGVGKDSLLEPVRHAVGAWNFGDVSPGQLLGRFNGFLKSVILRVSEARDQGDQGGGKLDRYAFYEHAKTLCASPPTTLLVDEKNVRAYPITNVLGMVITTNHRTDGIYLPPGDRRHYVAWSEATKEDFGADYWRELWSWYHGGGYMSVAAYLSRVDISGWDAKAPPPKTDAFWAIVDANKAPEDAELADALDRLGRPAAVTIEQVAQASVTLGAWLSSPANRRRVPHRFESAGYVPVRNDVNQGLWVVRGKRQTIYGRSDLTPRERFVAAAAVR